MVTDSPNPEPRTASLHGESTFDSRSVRGFKLHVMSGPDAGREWESENDRATVGYHKSCDLVLTDTSVSRFHCEITIASDGARIRDLGSRNHTIVDGVRTNDAYLKVGSLIGLGRTELRFQFLERSNQVSLSTRTEFGELVGQSVAMRGMFALLERVANTNITVLLQGETGTGKSATARSIHRESKRGSGPFVMLDCASIPANLLESELFGQEKGAFTGATSRKGSFEEAHGGTVFLDEIGEMPLELQRKLLSVLENRSIRRLGSNVQRPVDVRILAATNRDLRVEVNQRRFREDLFFRLAVVILEVPPLRLRLDDIPQLVARLSGRMELSPDNARLLSAPGFLDSLRRAAWPGNIRELRNYLERYLLFRDSLLDGGADPTIMSGDQVREGADSGSQGQPETAGIEVSIEQPFSAARKQVMAQFTRAYLSKLLEAHGGKITRAAAAAGMSRAHLYRLLQEYPHTD